MAKEREIMILDVNKKEVDARLRKVGAKYIGRYGYKRIEFLLKGNIRQTHSWGRVRTDGKDTTITVKRMHTGGGYTPMDEYEIKTSDFGETVRILSMLVDTNFMIYFETEREAYKLGNAYVTIDKWPEIPHYVEIEAPSVREVKHARKILGIKGSFVGNKSILEVYKRYGLNFKKVMKKNDAKLKRLMQ